VRGQRGTRDSLSGKRRHNTHVLSFEKIRYRYHPLSGTEVCILHGKAHGGSDRVLVELPDQTRCMLPAWMLDLCICSGLRDADTPCIALGALRTLCALVDSQSFAPCHCSEEHQPEGESNEPDAVHPPRGLPGSEDRETTQASHEHPPQRPATAMRSCSAGGPRGKNAQGAAEP
jgi:hypothetical protein